jgi:glycosyltransferase involved in cell wall biosynthesis
MAARQPGQVTVRDGPAAGRRVPDGARPGESPAAGPDRRAGGIRDNGLVRVAIDVRKLHDFGIGTYIRNLLRYLARIDRDTEYVLLCRERDLDVAPTLGANFRGVVEPSPNYSIREQLHVPWVLRRERPDVYHAPHYVLPLAVRTRSVVTIHDCIHLMFPQYLPNRAAYTYAWTTMRSAARRAQRILTVSEASKRDILHYCGVPPEKIVVVYNAIDERYWVPPAAEDIERVRERYQLHHRFVLYAGTIKPHKNLVRLIAAFAQLRREFDDVTLLIIGDEMSKLPALRRAVHGHKLHKYVRFLGYVDERTLAALYRLASVFAFPSLYEGFGLPPLEAMASGTPVVTSNVSSLPEVTGGAAVLVDPRDVEALVDGLAQVLREPGLAATLRARGLERARAFSWESSVARTLRVYREVAADRPAGEPGPA